MLKDTVFLPKTPFAMKAGLAKIEPETLAFWNEINLYKRIRAKSKGRKKFILHFGPPYANGNIHIGHALTYTLKDIVTKTKQMQGFDAPLVPGWDCHGLPIEWKIEEEYKAKGLSKDAVDPLELIGSCRSFAKKWVDIQREELKRLGILADFDKPYLTMDFKTESTIVSEISKFLMNGSLYKTLKPVAWSVVEKTALAEAEIEYKDHVSDSVYVAFKIKQTDIKALEDACVVIWTTTPWTLPGNRAIAYGSDLEYVVVPYHNRKLLVAKDLAADFCKVLEIELPKAHTIYKGSSLSHTICEHPLDGYDFDVPLIEADHVTTDAGTGFVHTAPGHGLEDFIAAQKYGIEVPDTVADDGTYHPHVPLFAGLHVYKANPSVMEALKDALLHHAKFTHSYPHSWRSKAPLIYRATPQWFISLKDIRPQALKALEDVRFVPERGRNRLTSMIESRPDWCVSRQRSWGVPIAIFVNKATGEPLRDQAVQDRIIKAFAEEGVEAWLKRSKSDFLGDAYNPDDYDQVKDIIDVWFDSGASHVYVVQDREDLSWPADLYLEGSDQHRGWFQSSLLESCGTTGKAPYKAIVTHGFTLDEKGYKMSKSLGNTVVPQTVIDQLGADILRLWIAHSDYTEDLRIGPEILKQQEDIYRRLRNTLRYLLGALQGFNASEKVDYDQMPSLEKWVLHRLSELSELHTQSVEAYDFSAFYTALHTFCTQDLSAFYFDIRKDSLYCDDVSDLKRRSARTVMDIVLNSLVRYLAPVLSFTAEEAWMCYTGNKETSIHEQEFLEIPSVWKSDSLGDYFKKVRDVRKVVTGALEIERNAKTIGSSLQAHVILYVNSEISNLLKGLDLSEIAITSNATVLIATPPADALTLDDVEDVGVVVNLAKGHKCERCWKVLPEVGDKSRAVPEVCHRCESVVKKEAA